MNQAPGDLTEAAVASGLSMQEARHRLAQDGYNELPSVSRRGIFTIALSVTREPMFLLLIVAGTIYLTLGDLREALILFLSILFVLSITIFQEQKTERALDALRDLTSPRALVRRDGRETRIAGRDVVRGDLLILTEGDRIPADAALLSCNDLMVDESLLTGESVPVRKIALTGTASYTRPGGDDLPYVYSGTMLVQGRGIARVISTGPRTEIGKIGKALQSVEADETFLQKKSAKLIRNLAVIGLSLCALAVVLYGITRGSWINGFLAGIALAMALLPEEIPVILTVFLAIGAWRMSLKNVLTRRMPAIETLGSATVLCVDKTGTLTFNRMSVSRLFADGLSHEIGDTAILPQPFHELVRFAELASETEPFDPMEKALRELAIQCLGRTAKDGRWRLVHEYSLSPELLALSHVWRSPTDDHHVIAAKGAPEAIADLCHFDRKQLDELAVNVESMASDGLRVIAVAKAIFASDSWPSTQHDFDFEFLGLIGLADPVRPEVPAAIRRCGNAGVKVVMITGDYPSTAAAIGRKIGLRADAAIMTGAEVETAHAGVLRRRLGATEIFARVLPEQKLNLVEAFKANGEVVAMTGDGVNDAPALKAAHIGIAMGGRGTDVARESAALVLLDDNFATIVEAIRSGRRIFDNLQKAMSFIFSIHVPIAGLALVPLFLDWPLVLMPMHIVFLELIIDPTCAIAFEAEAEESDIMQRPPRDPKTPLFAAHKILFSLLQGMVVLFGLLAVFGWSLSQGRSDNAARALTFAALVLGLLGSITVNRSWSTDVLRLLFTPNLAYRCVMVGALIFLLLVLYLPFLREVFRFAILRPSDLAIVAGVGVVTFLFMLALRPRRQKAALQVNE